MADSFRIPLSEVAPDARELVRAFRENGAISFESVPIEIARANYRRSCEMNGLAKEDIVSVRTVVVPVSGGAINVRIYDNAPTTQNVNRPSVFFVHGGGWVIGDLETHDAICRFIAKATGLPIAAVDYRLAPEFPYPVPLEDCREAFDYLSKNAEQVGLSMRNVIVFGDSAGANMATVIATGTDALPSDAQIIAQVLLYPVTDLTMSSNSHESMIDGFPLTAASMRWFADHYLPINVDRSARDISPLLFSGSKPQPPMFIVTVGHDPLSNEGIAYAGKAASSGTLVIHHHFPQHMHGIFTAAGKIDTGRQTLLEAVRFIASCCGGVFPTSTRLTGGCGENVVGAVLRAH